MRRLLIIATALTCTYAAVGAATAQAGFFLGAPVDDARLVTDIDLARDGSGGVVYVKSVGGADHIFVSRFQNGVFQAPERVDANFGSSSSQPVIAAAPDGRLAVAFVNGGFVQATVRPVGAGFTAPVPLGDGSSPSLDMTVNGAGMASFTSGSGDVRVARLDRVRNGWSTLAGSADVSPGNVAGSGTGRSKVALSADGVGVVTWGEANHVYARKIFVASGFSNLPQDLTPPSVGGKASTLSELPDIDAEEDSSYAWVVFRQVVSGGGARILARRQRGTQFDPPVAIDVGGEAGTTPRIDLTPRGVGLAAMSGATSRQPMAATIDRRDTFSVGARIFTPSLVPSSPTAAIADNEDGLVAGILGGLGQAPYVRVRPYIEGVAQADVTLSRPDLGGVVPGGGLEAAADRVDGVVVAWIQGGKLVAGYEDRPPGVFGGRTKRNCCVPGRPKLLWARSLDLWGAVRYAVYVDNVLAGTTTNESLKLPKKLKGIRHTWYVIATDVRGQVARSTTRSLVVDDIGPSQHVRFTRKGRRVSLVVRSRDPRRSGHKRSGIAGTVVTWGDGKKSSGKTTTAHLRHRYRRSGKFTMRIVTSDKAGNQKSRKRTVRVR